MLVLFVAMGGALGAVSRYWLSGWVQGWSGSFFPYGTLAVNVAGSLVLGLLLQITAERSLLPPEWRLFAATGFCGSLTTFSTFSLETLSLLRDAQWAGAGANVLLNVVLCLAATFAGLMAGRAL